MWYVAGWAEEFPLGKLVGQTIVGLPVVLWRSEAGPDKGRVVALDGRCCHKRMPLASGKLLADGTLECAYHGLCFNSSGKCVKIPTQPNAPIPTRAKVQPYPIAEQDGLVWIWMGEESPGERRPPRVPEMNAPEWECIHQPNNVVDANYLLLIENLLDISHFYPLHDGNIGDAVHSQIPVEFDNTSIDGNRSIKCIRQAQGYHHPPYLADFFGYEIVDRHHTHAMVSPALTRVDLRCAPPGQLGTSADRGYILTHMITPIDESRHNWRIGVTCRADHRWPSDPAVSTARRVASQFPSVVAQDLWALVEQQKMFDLGDDRYAGEMHLRSDAALLKAREIVRELAAAEASVAEDNEVAEVA
ncbi:MAG TPA: aromatic ring-hydroxylating dioxygenase subunit alpha [Ramlibacter sp.]|nr:aromatic ring-hydroxylating dioxygenase subunit alpha [Ramlibacter sp.]